MSAPAFQVRGATRARIEHALPEIAPKHRPRAADVQTVLRAMAATWKSAAGHVGPHCDLTVEQLAADTILGYETVRDCLRVLRRAGLIVTARRGGGRSQQGRGSLTFLALDDPAACPVCRLADPETPGETPGDSPPQFAKKLRGIQAETPGDFGETPGDQSPASVFSSVVPICRGAAQGCQCDACHPPGCTCDECDAGRQRIIGQIELPWYGDLAWWTPRDRRVPPPADGAAEDTA
jgi:hypothetical protein